MNLSGLSTHADLNSNLMNQKKNVAKMVALGP